MRSAGYHVRVVAQEDLGWEENPPTLIEFMRRDLRWCQGNMQYWRFLSLMKLKPVSRYQLMLAIVMFIGSPAWIGLLVLATIALVSFDSPAHFMRADLGNVLFAWILLMWFCAEDCDLRRLSAPPGCPPGIRRQRPHHRQFCNRDRLFDRALSHPLDQPHDLSRWVAL